MTTYDYLIQIQTIRSKIRTIEREIKHLSEVAESASAIDYTRESIQNGKADKEPTFVRVLDQVEEQKNKYLEMIISYNAIREKIFAQVNALPDENQARVLYKRFFENKKLEEIARETNYSIWRIRDFYRAGKREFRRRYSEEFDNE